jgi:hypothetical protein
MARLTMSTAQLRIYDDFLPQADFEPLLDWASGHTYRWPHQETWHKAWHTGDGLPLRGMSAFYRADGPRREHEDGWSYPSGAPCDPFIKAVNEVADEAAEVIGERGVAWKDFVATSFVHPRGCALSMHRDHTLYTGALTFYIHHEWDMHWGGHLLILDPRSAAGTEADDPKLVAFLSGENENRAINDPGFALCVVPRPNRLVLFGNDTYHMVTRVDDDAGDRPRVALAGFFYSMANR